MNRVLLLVVWLSACGGAGTTPVDSTEPAPTDPAAARFLAGLAPRAGSPFARLSTEKAWSYGANHVESNLQVARRR